MILSRRALLVGTAATIAAGAAEAAARDAEVTDATAALDAAAAEHDPAKALAILAPLRSQALSPERRLDLAAARSGLALDAALATATGIDRYGLLLKRAVGNDADPSRARYRLDAELARLLARAHALFVRLGDGRGEIGERYSRLWRDDRFLYSDDEAGRFRAVADMNATLVRFKQALPPYFAALPPYCLGVSARALTHEEVAAGKGGFRILPTPGTPGFYIADLKNIRARPRWTLPSVVAHELLPGHMVQMPLAVAARPHPLRTRYTPAFAEGWGIYAEELAGRAGAYADLGDALGHVHWLLFRVTRGIADLGIHFGGWSLSDAKAKLVRWMGEPAYFAPFDPDLARIANEPAVRAAEAVTWLAIADRGRRLGGASLRHYHSALLSHGPLRTESMPG